MTKKDSNRVSKKSRAKPVNIFLFFFSSLSLSFLFLLSFLSTFLSIFPKPSSSPLFTTGQVIPASYQQRRPRLNFPVLRCFFPQLRRTDRRCISAFPRNPAAPFSLLLSQLASAPPKAPNRDEEAQAHHHHASAAPNDANWLGPFARPTQRLLRPSRQRSMLSSTQLGQAPTSSNQLRPAPIQLTWWSSSP